MYSVLIFGVANLSLKGSKKSRERYSPKIGHRKGFSIHHYLYLNNCYYVISDSGVVLLKHLIKNGSFCSQIKNMFHLR